MKRPGKSASHCFDFRGHAGSLQIADTEPSSLRVTLHGEAKIGEEGLEINGSGGSFASIDSWEWGGTTSFEVYVEYDKFDTGSRVFDFGNIDFVRGASNKVGDMKEIYTDCVYLTKGDKRLLSEEIGGNRTVEMDQVRARFSLHEFDSLFGKSLSR